MKKKEIISLKFRIMVFNLSEKKKGPDKARDRGNVKIMVGDILFLSLGDINQIITFSTTYI